MIHLNANFDAKIMKEILGKSAVETLNGFVKKIIKHIGKKNLKTMPREIPKKVNDVICVEISSGILRGFLSWLL